MNIYVGNISWGLTQDDIQQLFAEYGPVINTNLIEDRETGRSRGFGFVEMQNAEDGKRAIEALNGQEVDGRALTVNEARPREERPPRRNFDRQDNRRGNDRRGNDRRNKW